MKEGGCDEGGWWLWVEKKIHQAGGKLPQIKRHSHTPPLLPDLLASGLKSFLYVEPLPTPVLHPMSQKTATQIPNSKFIHQCNGGAGRGGSGGRRYRLGSCKTVRHRPRTKSNLENAGESSALQVSGQVYLLISLKHPFNVSYSELL